MSLYLFVFEIRIVDEIYDANINILATHLILAGFLCKAEIKKNECLKLCFLCLFQANTDSNRRKI